MSFPDYEPLRQMLAQARVESLVLDGVDWQEVRSRMISRTDEECALAGAFYDENLLFAWTPGEMPTLRNLLSESIAKFNHTKLVLDALEPMLVSKMVWMTHAACKRADRPTVMDTTSVYVGLELLGLMVEDRIRAKKRGAKA